MYKITDCLLLILELAHMFSKFWQLWAKALGLREGRAHQWLVNAIGAREVDLMLIKISIIDRTEIRLLFCVEQLEWYEST